MKRDIDYSEIEIPLVDVEGKLKLSSFRDPDAKNKLNHRKASVAILIAVTVAVLVLVGYFVLGTFKIKNIYIDGNERINAEEIRNLSGISEKSKYFGVNRDEVAQRILKGFPLLEDAAVTKVFPSSVNITVREGKLSYYTLSGDTWYSFTCKMKVVDEAKYGERFKEEGLLYIQVPSDVVCVTGEYLRSSKNGAELSYIKVFSEAYAKVFADRPYEAEYIDLSDKFNLKLILGGGSIIEFGDVSDIEIKLLRGLAVLGDIEISSETPMIINISDPNVVISRPKNE